MKQSHKALILLVSGAIAATLPGAVWSQAARSYISIVGSSTVYPFATVVAEQFGGTGKFKTPKVESTGSGGGIKLFCSGVGVQYPDIANSSRATFTSAFDRSSPPCSNRSRTLAGAPWRAGTGRSSGKERREALRGRRM